MKIETWSRNGNICFTVHGETETEKALLTLITSHNFNQTKQFKYLSDTYSGDTQSVTHFTFGWINK